MIMVWYGVYLAAFGLGFYIMLHNDIDNEKLGPDNHNKFDYPILSLMKTYAMFVGEFDFDDLKVRGGDVSVSMSYIFLLVFIFLMVIVLMNVLNGLAVKDTAQMINESLIESQISIIDNVKYFETVYWDFTQIFYYFGFQRLNKFLKIHTESKKVSLFHSKHVIDTTLSFPCHLQTSERMKHWKRNQNSILRFYEWVKGVDDAHGAEDFLVDARKIVRKLMISRAHDRKQQMICKEIEKMKERESFDDKIKHLENILQRLLSLQSSKNQEI